MVRLLFLGSDDPGPFQDGVANVRYDPMHRNRELLPVFLPLSFPPMLDQPAHDRQVIALVTFGEIMGQGALGFDVQFPAISLDRDGAELCPARREIDDSATSSHDPAQDHVGKQVADRLTQSSARSGG